MMEARPGDEMRAKFVNSAICLYLQRFRSHANIMKSRKFDFYLCWNIVVVIGLAVFFYYFISSVM